MKILAIDLGKDKSVFVEYITGSTDPKQHTYGTIPTDPQHVHDLLAKTRPDRLVIEACPSAGWVHDLAAAMDIQTQVANTNDERWQWRRAKKKTDRVDALKCAQMSEMGCLPTVHVPSPQVRQWRSLIEYRHGLVDRRTAIKNSIRSIFHRQGERLPAGQKAFGVAGIAQLKKEAKPLSQCSALELWRGQLQVELEALESVHKQVLEVEAKLADLAKENQRVQLLQGAPCVGPRLSELVVAVLDEPGRFKNAKQVGAYAGLTPRRWQSGKSVREGHIIGFGHPLLRELLVEISWLGVRYNTWMKSVYENVRRGSDKRKKVAIVAVARRLLIRLWAMLRDGTKWKEPQVSVQRVGQTSDATPLAVSA